MIYNFADPEEAAAFFAEIDQFGHEFLAMRLDETLRLWDIVLQEERQMLSARIGFRAWQALEQIFEETEVEYETVHLN